MIKLCLDITKEETIEMTNDILRALSQALIVHLLSYSIDDEGSLFDEKTLKKFLYITLSMIIFNLIIKRLFVPKIKKNNGII
jgi:hypothetical protein